MTIAADRPGEASPDAAWQTFARHHAFIVGIDRYGPGIAPLRTAANDARRLAEVLAAQHHFTVHPPLVDGEASGAGLHTLLRTTMPAAVGADDRVLFYFAGHGIAADGDDGPAGYLVPADADPADLRSFVAMADLQAALDALPCRHLLLILDCCFSGAFQWSSRHRAMFMTPKRIYPTRFRRFVEDPARQVLTSAAHDQKALDVLHGTPTGERGSERRGNLEHSPFAAALFDALEGAADAVRGGDQEGDGIITATEVYAYLRDRIEPATLAAGERLRQTPSFFPLKGHGKGEFMFLHPRHRLNLPKMEPADAPYKGLDSFDESDQHLFYGRERVIAELRQRALDATQRLLVVAGPSGTGKSSVIKAGLLPTLRKDGLQILPVMRPGAHPIVALEVALAGATQPSVLLIDQYEELVTRCTDAEQRRAFEQRLAALLDEGHLVQRLILTVRSDFEPQLNTGALGPRWAVGRCTVPPFSPEELREVVVMPTLQASMIFDPPELVDTIVGEVVQSPGALPLLSFALLELFRISQASGRADRALTKADFDALGGGVMGALRQRADDVHRALQALGRHDALRRIMLRMVSLEGDLAGRRVARSDLVYDEVDDATVGKVIDELVAARLVVGGAESTTGPDGDVRSQQYVEPAHDALVRVWPQLREWIHEAGRENLILGGQVESAAKALDRHRSDDYLWHDNALLPAVLAELHKPHRWFNSLETAFIRRSERLRKARQMRRRAVATATFVIVSALGAWGWFEQRLAAGTIVEARGLTDTLLFDVMDDLRDLPGTGPVRRTLVQQVGLLQDKLGRIGAKTDHSTLYWTAVLDGDHELEQSRFDAARGRYLAAAAVIGAPLARDTNWQRNESLVQGKLGELEVRRAEATASDPDLRAAREPYERALEIDLRIGRDVPDNPLTQRDVFVSYARLGDLARRDAREIPEHLNPVDKAAAEAQQRAGRLEARRRYEQARDIARRLVDWPQDKAGLWKYHDPAQARRDLVRTVTQLGHIAFDLADTPTDADAMQAVEAYAAALVDAGRWHTDIRSDRVLVDDLLLASQRLVKLRLERDDPAPDAAREAAMHALRLSDDTADAAARESDAARREQRQRRYDAHMLLARVETARQDPGAARRAYAAAIAIAAREASDPDEAVALPWSAQAATAWLDAGRLEASQRRLADARTAYEAALRVARAPEQRDEARRCLRSPRLACP